MRLKQKTKLNLLSLEDRLTPAATLSFVNGNLTIKGDDRPTAIYVTGTAAALNISVTNSSTVNTAPGFNAPTNSTAAADQAGAGLGTQNFGTYNVTGNLTITTGNSADFVVIRLNDAGTLPGNVSISTGNGNDDIQLQTVGSNPAARATIQGRLSINGGLGAENIAVFDYNLANLVTVDGGGSGLRPNGTNTALSPNDALQLADINASNQTLVTNSNTVVRDVFFGGASTSTFNGGLIVNNSTANAPGDIIGSVEPAAFAVGNRSIFSGQLILDANTTVNGNVTYSGSSAGDAFLAAGTLNGSITFVGKGGNDEFSLLAGTTTVGGSVTVVTAGGTDSLSLGAGSTIFGSASFYLSEGANAYDLAGAFVINGTFNLTGGNGDDSLGTVGGSFFGNVAFNLGNGANTLVFTGTNAGTRFDYTGGSGVDSFTFNATSSSLLNVNLGAGADVFTFGALATSIGSATIDFGIDSDVDTYNPPAFPMTGNIVIRNYP